MNPILMSQDRKVLNELKASLVLSRYDIAKGMEEGNHIVYASQFIDYTTQLIEIINQHMEGTKC